MRPAVLIVPLCLLGTGCELIRNAATCLSYEVNLCVDHTVRCARDNHRAKAAWHDYQRANPGVSFSVHYASGFRDGYVDYLQAGGDGQPPTLPPRQYWKPTYQTVEGRQAVAEWFAGFHEGVAAAEASGFRQLLKVPSSLAVLPPPVVWAPAPEPALPSPRPLQPPQEGVNGAAEAR